MSSNLPEYQGSKNGRNQVIETKKNNRQQAEEIAGKKKGERHENKSIGHNVVTAALHRDLRQ
jgi:hypothetical protein